MNTHLLALCILPFVMLYTKCILLRRTGNTYTMYIYFNEFYKFYFYSNIYKETRMDRTQQYNITVTAIVVQVSSNNLHSFIQSVMDTYFEQMIDIGRNSNTVQSELSPIVQWMEFGPSPVTVLLNQNHFQYCLLPYIFFNIIDNCLLHY